MSQPRTQITIPTLCDIAWQSMDPAEGGRYCHHCQEKVIDFAAMSDSQLQQFFTALPPGAKICGSFRPEQLQPMQPQPKNMSRWKWLKGMATSLALLGTWHFHLAKAFPTQVSHEAASQASLCPSDPESEAPRQRRISVVILMEGDNVLDDLDVWLTLPNNQMRMIHTTRGYFSIEAPDSLLPDDLIKISIPEQSFVKAGHYSSSYAPKKFRVKMSEAHNWVVEIKGEVQYVRRSVGRVLWINTL